MKTSRIFLLILATLLIASLPACNRSPDPVTLIKAWAQALNDGDVDKALSYLTEDAVVTIVPAPPGSSGVFKGREQIRGWYEPIVKAHGIGTMSECKVEDNQVTCLDTYTDDDFKAMGVDFVEGEWLGIFKGDKIQSYTITMTPESMAKLAPAP